MSTPAAFHQIQRDIFSPAYPIIARKILADINPKMRERNPDWDRIREQRLGTEGQVRFAQVMAQTTIPDYRIERKDAGLWITFQK
nr:hypothetical protein [uncultured Holophaga sp.]